MKKELIRLEHYLKYKAIRSLARKQLKNIKFFKHWLDYINISSLDLEQVKTYNLLSDIEKDYINCLLLRYIYDYISEKAFKKHDFRLASFYQYEHHNKTNELFILIEQLKGV